MQYPQEVSHGPDSRTQYDHLQHGSYSVAEVSEGWSAQENPAGPYSSPASHVAHERLTSGQSWDTLESGDSRQQQQPNADSASPPSRYTRRGAIAAWLWEVVALVAAFGLLAAIYIILGRQNNQPASNWTFRLNLNTLIALLSTLYRGVIVVIAAEIISQAKWSFFWETTTPKPLLHFQRFDSASRGGWGATRMLLTAAKYNGYASISAVVILVSFAIGPFTQQAINSVDYNRQLPNDTPASLPIAHMLERSNVSFINPKSSLFGGEDLNTDAESSIFSAFLDPSSADLDIDPHCSSGNCVFPSWETGSLNYEGCEMTHATSGLCSTCFDVASLVQVRNVTSGPDIYLLPDGTNQTSLKEPQSGQSILIMGQPADLSWAGDVIPLQNMTQLRYASANLTLFTLVPQNSTTNGETVWKKVAVACSLYPCLRSYCASVTNGHLSETLLRTEPMWPDLMTRGPAGKDSANDTYTAVASSCLLNDTVYTASNFSAYPNLTEVRVMAPGLAPDYPSLRAPEQCIFRFESFFSGLLGSYLTFSVFEGFCNNGLSIFCQDEYWLARFYEPGMTDATYIADIFSEFSEALTKQFRQGLGKRPDPANDVQGVAVEKITFTVIEWQWLTFPLVLLVVEIVLLLWIVVRTIRYRGEEMVWKSSVLPVIYHRDRFVDSYGAKLGDLDRPTDRQDSELRLMSTSKMEDDARKVEVQLLRGTRWRSRGEVKEKVKSFRVKDMDSDSLLEQR